ncbi:hypothetical protein MF406_07565 [Georgenia sp. TF02-10]|uniref:hypothetical protein n=1 Tax=Georgenia sp. TF02-10 TaxID=2917725 RepID=UPI001FA73162|nr:hypothetical protein [Georgenia sp. TF02-10]UNX56056.1 hypothetical protein MF406_07565 [Georgenia sp. TF02-10]
MSLDVALDPAPADLRCSAKGCPNPAVHALLWNNPRLHTADRRKVWLACPEHRQHLADFLAARSFRRDVIGVADLDETHG